jgi:hypothetical protein
MKKFDGETSFCVPHLPIILLSLARDFYESNTDFSPLFTLTERRKKFSICINFFFCLRSVVEISFLWIRKGGFSSASKLLFRFSGGGEGNKNVNEIWFHEIK